MFFQARATHFTMEGFNLQLIPTQPLPKQWQKASEKGNVLCPVLLSPTTEIEAISPCYCRVFIWEKFYFERTLECKWGWKSLFLPLSFAEQVTDIVQFFKANNKGPSSYSSYNVQCLCSPNLFYHVEKLSEELIYTVQELPPYKRIAVV